MTTSNYELTLFALNVLGWLVAIYQTHTNDTLRDLIRSKDLMVLLERDRADTKAAQLRKVCKDPTLADAQEVIAFIKRTQ